MKGDSGVVKRSLVIRGHRTSISLEKPFWDALARLAARREVSVPALVAEIDQTRGAETNLSSAVRLSVLADALARADKNPT
jgi:predicted DNA-binding ribbon-helix-helix protein